MGLLICAVSILYFNFTLLEGSRVATGNRQGERSFLPKLREKKLNETRHGRTHESETDKSRARRAEYKGFMWSVFTLASSKSIK